nr:HAMP domain-containing sensor histidine kinase [Fulvivirga sediminis]
MTERIRNDYEGLKEFTENASHEFQTPLAIIKSNIDWLLQQVSDKEQILSLERIESSINRMSKTNKALLLLAKIENRNFNQYENASLESLVLETLESYEDFIQAKGLLIKKQLFNNQKNNRPVNKSLLQILTNNLISNAIKHNILKGYIHIYLDENKLIIKNSGHKLTVDPHKLFDRFAKDNPSSESSGLGLAMVKQICEILHYDIKYQCQENEHIITISFNL